MNTSKNRTLSEFQTWPRVLDRLLFDANLESRNYSSPLNIVEKSDALVLEFALPGLKKEDIHFTVQQGILEVAYQPKKTENSLQYRLKEFEISAFHRRFKLQQNINLEGIVGSMEQGILRIELPLLQKEKREINT